MGLPMARHLVDAGFRVRGWARRPETAQAAVAAGVEMRQSLPEVADGAEFVITMVTTSADVVEVVTGPGGLLEGAERDAVVIDMSTIAPKTSRQVAGACAARGVAFVDAPVSGGSFGAEAGTLSIMAGGHAATVARCRPLFEAMGDPERIFHTGAVGTGEVVKLANNMLVASISAATLEALLVGVRAGVPLATLVDVISVSSGASAQLTGQLAKRAFRGELKPGFSTDLLVKDLGLAAELAGASGQATPLTDLARALFERSQASGHGAEDYTAALLELEREAGVELRLATT